MTFNLRDLSQRGLPCQALTLAFSHVRKLNMKGEFMRIHTLNLDFSNSLTGFHEDCFTCMPNLKHLSLCETRISNLWTTIAALSKLPSLVELRFQNWLCCKDSGVCSTSSSVKSDNTTDSSEPKTVPYFGGSSFDIQELMDHNSSTMGVIRNLFSLNEMIVDHENPHVLEDSSDDSETEYSSYGQEYGYMESLSDVFPGLNGQVHLQNEVNNMTFFY